MSLVRSRERSFTDTDGTSLVTKYGSTVFTALNGFEVKSNGIIMTAAGISMEAFESGSTADGVDRGFPHPSDQWSRAEILDLSLGAVGVMVRCDAAGIDGYCWYANTSTTLVLGKWVGAVLTVLWQSMSESNSVNDYLRLEAEGTTLRGYVNETLKTTQTDSALASGFPGLICSNGSSSAVMDNYSEGHISLGVPINMHSVVPGGKHQTAFLRNRQSRPDVARRRIVNRIHSAR